MMGSQIQNIKGQVLPLLGSRPRRILESAEGEVLDLAEEIRLRPNQALLVQGGGKELWLPLTVNEADILETMNILSQYSYYAFAEQLARGYITVAGGHRVGVAGRVTVSKGKVAGLVETGSINIRIARQLKGVGKAALPWLFDQGQLQNTLILAAPGCGKTTLLRDLIRLISDEVGFTVGVADERSEVAGCYRGIPQLDVGRRTDVIDGCPRDQGLEMLVRSMGPQVVAADEIGCRADLRAVENVLAAGVVVLTTAHARDLEEARKRPVLRNLLGEGFFQRAVVLKRRGGIPALAEVADLPGGKLLYRGDR